MMMVMPSLSNVYSFLLKRLKITIGLELDWLELNWIGIPNVKIIGFKSIFNLKRFDFVWILKWKWCYYEYCGFLWVVLFKVFRLFVPF